MIPYTLTANPQSVFGISPQFVKQRSKLLLKSLPLAKPFQTINSTVLHLLSADGEENYFAVAEVGSKQQVVFLATLTRTRLLKLSVGRQTLVWKHPLWRNQGLASEFFFALLKKHRTLVTDKRQTDAGELLWGGLLIRALLKRKKVYRYDFRTSQRKLEEATTDQDLDALISDTWNIDPSYQKVLLLISEVPLKLPRKGA